MLTQVHIKEKKFEAAVARLNITYKDLAKRLGINRIYLSNIKNPDLPEFRPSGKLRKLLLKELDVEFDDIFEIRQGDGASVLKRPARKRKAHATNNAK